MSKKIQVLSPHFDDAVLSCGQHILEWQAAGYEVEVITVFTEFEASVLSADSASFVAECGVSSLKAFRQLRENEDRLAMKRLGVKKYQWLGIVDGGFRESEGVPVYRTHDHLFAGKVLDSDDWIDQLSDSLQNAIDPQAIVVIPLGFGAHADHLIVRNAIQRFHPMKHLLWYADVPYVFQVQNWNVSLLNTMLQKHILLKWSRDKKLDAVGAYAAQVPILFPEGVWQYPECLIGQVLPRQRTKKE